MATPSLKLRGITPIRGYTPTGGRKTTYQADMLDAETGAFATISTSRKSEAVALAALLANGAALERAARRVIAARTDLELHNLVRELRAALATLDSTKE